jgi:hypothetical protein
MSFCFHFPFSHPALTPLENSGFGVGVAPVLANKKSALRRLGAPGGGVMGQIDEMDLMDPINCS